MKNNAIKWLKKQFNKTINSIAFLPAITALIFLLLSYLMVEFDFSETGKSLKAQWQWLRLKDATTARSIISTIASGIISLTVFSFSMVMIVLNQAASQLSNRILDKLIGNRFQQIVLGFYIGTIVYSLFLLSTIRDIDSGIHVPAISTYLLILFTVLDIFLFIYFLHYITQSVKYETIIKRIHRQTQIALKESCLHKNLQEDINSDKKGCLVKAAVSGIYQGFERNNLLQLCLAHDLNLSFIYPTETFILKGTPILVVDNQNSIPQELEEIIQSYINTENTQNIKTNYFYGFRQLMEIAIKALSPGINDPGTAVISLHALTDLLAYRSQYYPEKFLKDKSGSIRITVNEKSFDEIFTLCIMPIWDYGKEDRLIQNELYHLLIQLKIYSNSQVLNSLHEVLKKKVSIVN